MSQLTDRLERDLREIAAGAHPSPSAWESIVSRLGDDTESDVALVVAPAPARSKRPVWIAAAAAALVVIAGSAVLVTRADEDDTVSTDTEATTIPSVVPPSTVPVTGPATSGAITTIPSDLAPPSPVPAIGTATSGGMWPQSTLDEVRSAQALADAADPAATWQLFPQVTADEEPWEAPILTRFIEDGLGWEEYLPRGYAYADGGGGYGEVVVIRCAPGGANPLAPLYEGMPPEIRGCAPTIDDLTYETVMLSLTQPERRGASGIWVVEEWEILQSASEGALFWLLYPDLGQVQQAIPPPDDEVSAFLEAFLSARVEGAGAEQFLLTEPGVPDTVAPLLYATTDGVPYDTFAAPQLLEGPVWPTGWREYQVRLIAQDGTVVEQRFHVVRTGGQLGLIYGFAPERDPTTEDGAAVAVPHSEFGDTVTFTAPPSVPHGDGSEEIQLVGEEADGRVVMAVDPNPELCFDPPEIGENVQPVDASAVARSILALPDVEATGPVPARIAGTDGLQIDVTSSGRVACVAPSMWMDDLLAEYGDWRMRIYLVDYPEWVEPGSDVGLRVLSITVIAAADRFEAVHELATPILESIAFRQR